MKSITHAKVQVTVEVSTGTWGDDCPTSQVFKQSSESALGTLEKVFREAKEPIKIVGVSKILSVTTERS